MEVRDELQSDRQLSLSIDPVLPDLPGPSSRITDQTNSSRKRNAASGRPDGSRPRWAALADPLSDATFHAAHVSVAHRLE